MDGSAQFRLFPAGRCRKERAGPLTTQSGLRAVLAGVDPDLARAAGRAAAIVERERTYRLCGRCGTPPAQKGGEWARACPHHRLAAH